MPREPMKPKRHVSPWVGRPMTISSSRRVVNDCRDKAQLKLWKSAPACVQYLADVVGGRADFNEGKFRAAVALMSRTLPTVSAQSLVTDSTSISASVSLPQNVAEELRGRLDRLAKLQALALEADTIGPDEERDG